MQVLPTCATLPLKCRAKCCLKTFPAAARISAGLLDLYGDNLIVSGVHVTTTFASPLLTQAKWNSEGVPDSSFMTDFRIPAGDAIFDAYTPVGLPNGVVSRRPFNNSTVIGRNSWASAVQQIICQEAQVALTIDSLRYDTATRALSLQVNAVARVMLSGTHAISVLITENGVVDWQLDAEANPVYVEFYEHNHVLRDKIDAGGNSLVGGDVVLNGSANVGDVLSTRVNGYILNPDWDASNCNVVAFISDASGEVVQAVELQIAP